jgi:hypothetical protein
MVQRSATLTAGLVRWSSRTIANDHDGSEAGSLLSRPFRRGASIHPAFSRRLIPLVVASTRRGLSAVEPERLAHFEALRTLPVNHACSPADARSRIALYRTRIDEGFAMLADSDLSQVGFQVFVNDGEPLLTLLLGNLEHLVNHKHQLFTYLMRDRPGCGHARPLPISRRGVTSESASGCRLSDVGPEPAHIPATGRSRGFALDHVGGDLVTAGRSARIGQHFATLRVLSAAFERCKQSKRPDA